MNQVFSSAFWLTSFIPTITTPLVAAAHAKGDTEAVQRHIGAAIFASVTLGMLITAALALWQQRALLLVGTAPGLPWSLPYLRWRLPGVIPDAASVVGFAAFRGVSLTRTSLQQVFLHSSHFPRVTLPICHTSHLSHFPSVTLPIRHTSHLSLFPICHTPIRHHFPFVTLPICHTSHLSHSYSSQLPICHSPYVFLPPDV